MDVQKLFEEFRDFLFCVIEGQIMLRSAWINNRNNLEVAYHSNDDGCEYNIEFDVDDYKYEED